MDPLDPKPFLVGITGGIGAGKSTVSKVFEVLGVPVYDADSRARWLMENHDSIISELKSVFGEEAYEGNRLNAEFFRQKAFNDSDWRKELNQIVHPRVGEDFKSWVRSNHRSPYLVKEAALMIESGSYKDLDLLIGVFAPKDERKKRIMKRDPFRNGEQIDKIMEAQLPEEEMRNYCQLQIENNGKEAVLEEILNFDISLRDHLSQK